MLCGGSIIALASPTTGPDATFPNDGGLLACEKGRIQHGNFARRFSPPVSSQIHEG